MGIKCYRKFAEREFYLPWSKLAKVYDSFIRFSKKKKHPFMSMYY